MSCTRGLEVDSFIQDTPELEGIDGRDIDGRGCLSAWNCTTSRSSFKLTGRPSTSRLTSPLNAGWSKGGSGGTIRPCPNVNPEDGMDPEEMDAYGVKGSGMPSAVDAGVRLSDVLRLPAVLGRDLSVMFGLTRHLSKPFAQRWTRTMEARVTGESRAEGYVLKTHYYLVRVCSCPWNLILEVK
ncbi:hypothetical protein BDZ89DRAFT_709267 [Hymenopellis radicata]|nr:hypothetical protein BDZ89DRAFT_709267 [Hymenopellis radicata]